jgi:uncharacterized membrane protein (Fun14 family)
MQITGMENLYSSILTIGGGFFAGTLMGYALKKVLKLVAVVVGLFLAGLAYLQYHQIIAISWNKIPRLSQNSVNALANATTQIPVFSSDHTTSLAMTKFGIPLTGSMAMGFAVGFMKG